MNDVKVTNAVAITHIDNAIQWLKFFKDSLNMEVPDKDRPFNTGLGELEKAKAELSKKCSQINDPTPINGTHYRGNGIPGGITADREIVKEN